MEERRLERKEAGERSGQPEKKTTEWDEDAGEGGHRSRLTL